MSPNPRLVQALVVAACCCAARAGAFDKQQTYDELLRLAAQMEGLKAGGSPAYSALAARYRELSQALGGDHPARQLRRSRARSARSETGLARPVGGIPQPQTPPGCMLASRTFTNSSPVVIPAAAPPNVVASTINVVGLAGFVVDVDVRTFIRHSASGDLDITLTSPSGRVVTLTTDNGGMFDDVFNGTLWDDQADAPGQFGNTAVDYAYADLVTAPALTPEEPLGAFRYVPVSGPWTLTISDDTVFDGGSLDQWSLTLRTVAAPVFAVGGGGSNATPVPIPDLGTITSTITLPPGVPPAYIGSLTLATNITHTFPADLDVTLTSPSGTVVTVTSDNGGSSNNAFAGTYWREDANPGGQVPYTSNNGVVTDQTYTNGVAATPLTPEEPFSAFLGEAPAGTWTLGIRDDASVDVGTLQSWDLSYLQWIECRSKGDYGGDGNDSLVLRNVNSNQHVMWFMDEVTRVSGALVSPPPGATQHVVGSDDFVQDGVTDLVLHDSASGQVEFWKMAGTATRVGPAVPLTGAAPVPLEWKLAATGDFNHDGFPDIVWRNSLTQSVVIWTLGEAGAPSTQKTGAIVPDPPQAANENWEIVAALDFDHDNNRDLLWYNNTSGNIVVWFMDENVHRITGAFTSPANAGNANWRVVAAGDYGPGFFGDRRPDIVWRNDTSGKFVVWYMDGGFPTATRLAGVFTSPDSPASPLDWRIVGPR